MPETETIPVVQHECQAVRHIEDLACELDELRHEVRASERRHSEDMSRIWRRIGAMMLAIAAVLPSGWAAVLGLI